LEISGSTFLALDEKAEIDMSDFVTGIKDSIQHDAPILIVVLLFGCMFYLEKIARRTEAIRYLLEFDNKQKYPHMF
jgi:hypothetical protein